MISVIVPVYNVEIVLHYCLDSILAQTYSDFELILIDDGSKDNSGKICDEYAAKDNRVIVRHIENQGVSHARNYGIELAAGEYILFIDSDDFVDKQYLEKLINLKKNYPKCDNIWCGFRTVDSYESPVSIQNIIYSEEKSVTLTSTKEIMTLHEKWLDAGPVCKLYNRRIVKANKILFDINLTLGEDLLFNFSYLDKTNGSIAILNEMLYNYLKLDDGTLSSKYYPDLFDIYRHNNAEMQKYLVRWKCDKDQICSFYNSCYFLYEKALRNTFYVDSKIKRKHRYNKSIIKSGEFSEAIEKSNCFIHPVYRMAYRCHSSRFVRFLDLIYSARKR